MSWHDPPRMDNVKYDKGNEHREGINTVLISFVVWNIALQALRVLDKSENDPRLGGLSAHDFKP